MKKLLVIVVCLGVSAAVMAQKARFGVKAGYNLANVTSNDPEIKEDGKGLSTFNIGAVVDIAVSKNFHFQPQLNYNGKGISVSHGGHADRYRFNVLDLPLNAVYRANNGFYIGGGPNIGFNLSGGLRSSEDPSENFDFKFGSGVDQVKRTDFGFNFMTGYETKSGLTFGVNYLAGLTNLSNAPGNTWRNNVLGVSVGYFFNKK
jgi:hypothetical protein